MFPYECIFCDGAYERCGAGCNSDCTSDCGSDCEEEHECEGGQFCWEPTGVLIPSYVERMPEGGIELDCDNLPPVKGRYDGYGDFETDDYNPRFVFITEEGCGDMSSDPDVYVIMCKVACVSCFMNNYHAKHGKVWSPDVDFYDTLSAHTNSNQAE